MRARPQRWLSTETKDTPGPDARAVGGGAGGLRRRLHPPIGEQGGWLRQVEGGFFAYHAVPTNAAALGAFRSHVIRDWLRALTRRGQKDRTTWERIVTLADRWLPKPRITHPWPDQRFAVRHPRWEPYAGKPHVRFRAGGTR